MGDSEGLVRRGRWGFRVIALLLVFVLLEGTLQVSSFLLKGQSASGEQQRIEDLLAFPFFASRSWAREYWEEFYQSHGEQVYAPFIVWDRAAFAGRFINVNDEGVRRTWNPDFVEGDSPLSVFVFGGSTCWGTGARDEYTIPSLLSKQLNAEGARVRVTNYGESGYTFAQELVQLSLVLKSGKRPRVVLFYDGVNDVYAAYQNGNAGGHQNLDRMKKKLSAKKSTLSASQHFRKGFRILRNKSIVYTQLKKIPRLFLSSRKRKFKERAANYSEVKLEKLSEDVIASYQQGIAHLEKLSNAYDFQFACFWQPVSYTEAKLFDSEKSNGDSRMTDTQLAFLYQSVNHSLESQREANFYNISDALKDRNEASYFDFCHVTEDANERVASRIAAILHAESWIESK